MTGVETILDILDGDIDTATVRRAFKALREFYPESIRTVDMRGVPQKDGALLDEEDAYVGDLLGDPQTNPKIALSNAHTDDYVTYGLSLAPSTQNGLFTASGKRIDFCPKASPICRMLCLFQTGRGRVSRNVRRARIAKSRLFVKQADYFKARLLCEVARALVKARSEGKTLVIRLNVFSEIIWERAFPELFRTFPGVRFYDYTKVPNRKVPTNYHITFSRSEENHATALEILGRGQNVAVVFEDHSFEATWNGFPVINGTLHDLRILDPEGVVVALAEKDTQLHGPLYKGKRNEGMDTAGFVLPTSTSNVHNQPLTLV